MITIRPWRYVKSSRYGDPQRPAACAIFCASDAIRMPEEFEKLLREEIVRRVELVKVSGAKAD